MEILNSPFLLTAHVRTPFWQGEITAALEASLDFGMRCERVLLDRTRDPYMLLGKPRHIVSPLVIEVIIQEDGRKQAELQ